MNELFQEVNSSIMHEGIPKNKGPDYRSFSLRRGRNTAGYISKFYGYETQAEREQKIKYLRSNLAKGTRESASSIAHGVGLGLEMLDAMKISILFPHAGIVASFLAVFLQEYGKQKEKKTIYTAA